jgi:hypothetical protein
MKRIFLFVFLLFGFSLSLVHAQDPSELVRKVTQNLYMGETQIQVAFSQKQGSDVLYFNMHDDENTSVQATRSILERMGGNLIEVLHGGERNIKFQVKGRTFEVDPNRIFTPEGVRKTLEKNSAFTPEAASIVKAFAESLVVNYRLDKAKMVVALHNNTPDNYEVRNYQAGQVYANDAAAVNYVRGSDYDDFFFVTDRRFYDALKNRGFNVALQNNASVTDDGSFSVFCGNKSIPYINVEAEHGHVAPQTRMLEAVVQLFGH